MVDRQSRGNVPPPTWARFVRPALFLFILLVALWVVLGRGGGGDHAGTTTSTTGSEPSRLLKLEVNSSAVGKTLPVNVIEPADEGESEKQKARRGAVIFLHGRGSTQDSVITTALYESLRRMGPDAPVMIFPYGDDSSYFHDRDSGDWPNYVLHEALDEARNVVLFDRDRLAIGGISMGGFGALNIAFENPDRFCAVAGHSPAIFMSGAETAEAAFDDAEDFEAHDLVRIASERPGVFGKTPIWIDVGEEDPFLEGASALAGNLKAAGTKVTWKIGPGGHTGAYWDGNWDRYLRFYAESLATCDARRNLGN